MEFISSEEFLKQPKEVQKIFMKWWKPQPFDLYIFDKRSLGLVKKSDEDYILPYRGWNIWQEKKECIPLFTESRLMQFILEKSTCEVNIGNVLKIIDIYRKELCIPYETDFLQALWKVALEVAKESVENE